MQISLAGSIQTLLFNYSLSWLAFFNAERVNDLYGADRRGILYE